MTKAAVLAKDPKYAGFVVAPTTEAELEDEVFTAPPAEQSALFAAYIRRKHQAADERAQQRIDALLDSPEP